MTPPGGPTRPLTGRILWIELRRSAVLATLISTGAALVSIAAVRDGMNSVASAQREGLVFLGALALALGAWRARRDRRSGTLELFATTARPTWQRLLAVAAALAIGPVAGYLIAYAAVTAYAAAIGAYVPVGAVIAGAVTACNLAATYWLGLAIGRLLPYVFVPPLLVVVGFVAAAFLALSADLEGYAGRTPPGTVLLNPMQMEGFESFETLTAAAQLAQAAWAVGIAAAALLMFVAARYLRLAAIVPVALGLAVALPLLPSDVNDAIVPDRGALALECTTDQPRVCVRRAHAALLDQLRDPGREALSILASALPQAPTTVVEAVSEDIPSLPDPQPDPDVLFIQVFNDGGTDRDLLWDLLDGAGTPWCANVATTEQADRSAAARLIAAAWLLGEEPRAALGQSSWVNELPYTAPGYETFAALPADEQRARVAELRAAELACDRGDRLDILVGDAG